MSTRDAQKRILTGINAIKEMMALPDAVVPPGVQFNKGELIFKEGDKNDSIILILDGQVQLSKKYGEENDVAVGRLGPGDLMGLLSFYSEESVFVSVKARTPVRALRFHRTEFEKLSAANRQLYELLQPLIMITMTERYRRIVNLHLEVAVLTKELESERNHLQDTLRELKETRNRLIHQEKMATLGQLIAGIAHEINNPASAVLRSVDSLIEQLPPIIASEMPAAFHSLYHELLQNGIAYTLFDTGVQRERMEYLASVFPVLNRTALRLLSRVNDENIERLKKFCQEDISSRDTRTLETALQFFEIGTFLKNMKISAERISHIVQSLKGYSRESGNEPEEADLREGIKDTLLIFGKRLRNISVELKLHEIPPLKCRIGEMNQVWTNIIINACDAMGDAGAISITTDSDEQNVYVTVADSGPGIPSDIAAKIFEPNFTTKTASGNFGLGLGLAIANEIVQKQGGIINVTNADPHGAVFRILLPRK